jgi:hypothetical protein
LKISKYLPAEALAKAGENETLEKMHTEWHIPANVRME